MSAALPYTRDAVGGDLPAGWRRAHPLRDRLVILMEKLAEVNREFNDARDGVTYGGLGLDLALLSAELIQAAAMAVSWADAIGRQPARL